MKLKHIKDDLQQARDKCIAKQEDVGPLINAVDKALLNIVALEEDAKYRIKKLDEFCLEWEIDKKRFPAFFKTKNGYVKGDEKAPFFSEAFLYVMFGKEDARTILGLLYWLKKFFIRVDE